MIDQDIKKLENLAQKMESDELPLEESLKVFNEGIELIRQCSQKLESAELKVKEILKEADGSFSEKDVGSA